VARISNCFLLNHTITSIEELLRASKENFQITAFATTFKLDDKKDFKIHNWTYVNYRNNTINNNSPNKCGSFIQSKTCSKGNCVVEGALKSSLVIINSTNVLNDRIFSLKLLVRMFGDLSLPLYGKTYLLFNKIFIRYR
jgi:hypothetical protein